MNNKKEIKNNKNEKYEEKTKIEGRSNRRRRKRRSKHANKQTNKRQEVPTNKSRPQAFITPAFDILRIYRKTHMDNKLISYFLCLFFVQKHFDGEKKERRRGREGEEKRRGEKVMRKKGGEDMTERGIE